MLKAVPVKAKLKAKNIKEKIEITTYERRYPIIWETVP